MNRSRTAILTPTIRLFALAEVRMPITSTPTMTSTRITAGRLRMPPVAVQPASAE